MGWLTRLMAWVIAFQVAFGGTILSFPTHALAGPTDESAAVTSSSNSDTGETEARADAQELASILKDPNSDVGIRSRLDTYGLFDFEPPTPVKDVDASNLGVRLLGEGDAIVLQRYANLASAANSGQEIALSPQAKPFSILSRGEAFLRSRVSVNAVAFYDRYLVFIEPGSYSSSLPGQTEGAGVQVLSFIDLKKYASLLGKESEAPPIFSVPVAVGGPVTALRSNGGVLELVSPGAEYANGAAKVPASLLKKMSEVFELTMTVSANLIDPSTYENAQATVEEAERYFLQAADEAGGDSVEQVATLRTFAADMHAKLNKLSKDVGQARRTSLEAYQKGLEESPQLLKGLKGMERSQVAQRRFTTRLTLILSTLSLPKPAEAPRQLREALAMVSAGLSPTAAADREFLLKEGMLQFLNHRYARAAAWGAGVAAATVLGVMYPEQVTQFGYQALDVGRAVLGSVLGKTREIWSLGKQATFSTFVGWKPSVFYQTYLADGKYKPFLVGVSGVIGTGVAMVATAIYTVNAWLLARDLKRMDAKADAVDASGSSRIQRWVDAFVKRQRQTLVGHLKKQEAAQRIMAQRFNQDAARKFTAEDNETVRKIIEEVEVKNASFFRRMISKVGKWRLFRKKTYDSEDHGEAEARDEAGQPQVQAPEGAAPGDSAEVIAEERIQGFGSALRMFVASYASMVDAFGGMVRGWNGFTIFRRMLLSPAYFVTQVMYPNFSNVALGNGTRRELVLPSEANGGLLTTGRGLSRAVDFLTFDPDLDVVKAWEEKIIPVETEIMKEALRSGYRALVRFTADRGEEISGLLKQGAISSLSSKALSRLTRQQRIFFYRYVETLSTQALRAYLTDVAGAAQERVVGDATIAELKQMTLADAASLRIDPSQAKSYVEGIERGSQELYRDATNVATSFDTAKVIAELKQMLRGIADPEKELELRGLIDALKEWATGAVRSGPAAIRTGIVQQGLHVADPKNTPTMGRIQTVLKMLEKPDSLPRAVRSTLSALITEKVFGLGMALMSLAGQTSGVLVPFHPGQMFGPDSYFYMGRVPFLGGLLVGGLLTSLFANAWVKLQTDAQHSDHFGEVPEGENQNLSYMQWYLKQTFKNPENTWWGNQKVYTQIIWGNMKPAFVLMGLTNMISLGRFDLDGYVGGYLIAYLNPFNGFNQKLEQGNEFASFYFLKDFPREYWAHPLVQEYLARRQQEYRFKFAVFEKLYTDVQGSIIGNFQRMGAVVGGVTYANEALLRMLMGGYSPTELVQASADTVAKAVEAIPGASTIVRACPTIFNHGYTSWDAYHPEGSKEGSAPAPVEPAAPTEKP